MQCLLLRLEFRVTTLLHEESVAIQKKKTSRVQAVNEKVLLNKEE
jgi:hypothetical protein